MKRVLIVDDDRATSAGMADVVEEWGYEPEVADTVKAGWNAINKLLPDVAIVDLKLPDGSGLDLLHRIKESFPTSRSSSSPVTPPSTRPSKR
jgi:DNA-binding response OmpR family regulator